MTSRRILASAAAIGALGVAGWIGISAAMATGGAGILPYDDPEAVGRGAQIYQENCAACHGAQLEGQANWRERGADGLMPAPPHDRTGHTWHHADTLLFRITKYGSEAVIGNGYRSAMIGFGDVLSDADILDVLAYIKSTWPDEVIGIHDQINEDAARQ